MYQSYVTVHDCDGEYLLSDGSVAPPAAAGWKLVPGITAMRQGFVFDDSGIDITVGSPNTGIIFPIMLDSTSVGPSVNTVVSACFNLSSSLRIQGAHLIAFDYVSGLTEISSSVDSADLLIKPLVCNVFQTDIYTTGASTFANVTRLSGEDRFSVEPHSRLGAPYRAVGLAVTFAEAGSCHLTGSVSLRQGLFERRVHQPFK